jgi:hypothetical protein
MSLQSFIDEISKKPDHIRKRYSFFISLGITAIIFIFWISSFSFVRSPAGEILSKKVDEVGTPAQSLVASVGSFFTDIKDIFFGPKKVEYTTIEVKPGRK